MRKIVVIWGLGKGFWELFNIIKMNEDIGNFQVEAYMSKDDMSKVINGKRSIRPEELGKLEIRYDYIIVTSDKFYKEIVNEGNSKFNIERRKFINGKVLKIPYFDWDKYIQIYSDNISVVAETCLGGAFSHYLGLPFNSPFVNVRVGIQKTIIIICLNI